MARWWWTREEPSAAAIEAAVRDRYERCRALIAINNECLELLADVQDDLAYVPPLRDVLGARVDTLFGQAGRIVSLLEDITDGRFPPLRDSLHAQQRAVDLYLASEQELVEPRLSASLSELGMADAAEIGGKSAALGEIKSRLGIPVPDGYVLTTSAYRRFLGVPQWARIRDALRSGARAEAETLAEISRALGQLAMSAPLPRAVEVAIVERAAAVAHGAGLAVRSSACGEGGAHSFAGQFSSRINVPVDHVVDAYRRVVASRFSQRALAYRFATGLSEVDTAMAVLVLPTLRARTSGIVYTRDPANGRSRNLWITSAWGLGLGVAGGTMAGDLFVVSRARPHRIVERRLAEKASELVAAPAGGVVRRRVEAVRVNAPSLEAGDIERLARWAVAIERHFGAPQDIEWALDERGELWILQARPLALASPSSARMPARVRAEPMLRGGRTIYPGRVSGPAYLVRTPRMLHAAPAGAIVFVRRAAAEIIRALPAAAGVVAESGNLTGHAAALLREFRVPSVLDMTGAFDRVSDGDAVSLDSVQPALYAGTLWVDAAVGDRLPHAARRDSDPIRRRVLALNLVNPSGFNFRASGCRSLHDVIRFCHERAIEAMFALNDRDLRPGVYQSRKLLTPAPVNLHVLDLGRGLRLTDAAMPEVRPGEIVSRPFQALWRGVTHPGVTWKRDMPASIGGLASVMAGGLSSTSGARRALGEKSYLIVTSDYMNLNSRLAYHFSLVDAVVSDLPGDNYVFFRFAGGAAAQWRRDLRAALIEASLGYYGFHVERRGDLVNAWFKKAPALETEERLDILGRLMACTSQLDMYMTGEAAMRWYLEQFVAGNYGFGDAEPEAEAPPPSARPAWFRRRSHVCL